MDISSIISKANEPSAPSHGASGQAPHPYSTRHGNVYNGAPDYHSPPSDPSRPSTAQYGVAMAPNSAPGRDHAAYQPPKSVEFQLKLSDHNRARLPMRVQIHATDRPESILDSVQKFWGLYDGRGISLEDENGNTLIAQYENFVHNRKVYVRVFPAEHAYTDPRARQAPSQLQTSFTRPQLGQPIQMLPPQNISRPSSRTTRVRDASPRSFHRTGMVSGHVNGEDEHNDSDGGSVTSSRRARSELPSTEISLENIVEGGRRARMAKFESSELPLFVPPQQPMTTSISSMSPQRRVVNGNGSMQSPSHFLNQKTFSYSYNQPLLSPQSYGHNGMPTPNTGSISSAMANGHSASSGQQFRASGPRAPARLSGSGSAPFFPTPDPTNVSTISDEDVAWQLLRLGETSNMSSHGRKSTSTLDDTLSGKAEAASIGNASEDEGRYQSMLPPRRELESHGHGHAKKKQKQSATKGFAIESASSEDYEDWKDESFKGESDEIGPDAFGSGYEKTKPKANKAPSRRGSVSSKGRQPTSKTRPKPAAIKIPPSPYAAPPTASRKVSSASASLPQQPGDDDDDLSTKPRCQRCRKSKKGCDRQRPCQRCKDAGIGIEGCISEDEGNGRKGRFGRHMGVPLAVKASDAAVEHGQSPADSTHPPHDHFHGNHDPITAGSDAGKKRKR